jgi:SAM-dependent methyltransferase
MLKIYKQEKATNRMLHEADIANARKEYKSKKNKNLARLLENRFLWMNTFIDFEDSGLELGAGIGASKDFIKCNQFIITDFNDFDWLDHKNVDALETNYTDETFDFVIASNVIHHLAFPKIFFDEIYRILKPNGRLIIQDIYTSILMRLVLRAMRHEGYDESADPFGNDRPCNDPDDPWSANCSIPKILFNSRQQFELHFPQWELFQNKKAESLMFLNSGGVVAKTIYFPLGSKLLKTVEILDRFLCRISPDLFALQCQVVLIKKDHKKY